MIAGYLPHCACTVYVNWKDTIQVDNRENLSWLATSHYQSQPLYLKITQFFWCPPYRSFREIITVNYR